MKRSIDDITSETSEEMECKDYGKVEHDKTTKTNGSTCVTNNDGVENIPDRIIDYYYQCLRYKLKDTLNIQSIRPLIEHVRHVIQENAGIIVPTIEERQMAPTIDFYINQHVPEFQMQDSICINDDPDCKTNITSNSNTEKKNNLYPILSKTYLDIIPNHIFWMLSQSFRKIPKNINNLKLIQEKMNHYNLSLMLTNQPIDMLLTCRDLIENHLLIHFTSFDLACLRSTNKYFRSIINRQIISPTINIDRIKDNHVNMIDLIIDYFEWDPNCHLVADAAKIGRLDIVQYCVGRNCPKHVLVCNYAVTWGHINILEWLLSNQFQLDITTLLSAIYSNNEVIVEHLLKMTVCDQTQRNKMDNVLKASCTVGNVNILKLLIRYGYTMTRDVVNHGLRTQNEGIVRWIIDEQLKQQDLPTEPGWHLQDNVLNIPSCALDICDIGLFYKLIESGFLCDLDTLVSAINYGNIEMAIMIINKYNFEIDPSVYMALIDQKNYGSFSPPPDYMYLFNHFYNHGVNLNETIFVYAIHKLNSCNVCADTQNGDELSLIHSSKNDQNQDYTILEWLKSKNCPYPPDVYRRVICTKNVKLLEWLYSNQYPPYGNEYLVAAGIGNVDMLQVIIKKTPKEKYDSYQLFNTCIERNQTRVIRWLIDTQQCHIIHNNNNNNNDNPDMLQNSQTQQDISNSNLGTNVYPSIHCRISTNLLNSTIQISNTHVRGAIKNSNVDFIKLMIELDYPINIDCLNLAIQEKSYGIVKSILESGFDWRNTNAYDLALSFLIGAQKSLMPKNRQPYTSEHFRKHKLPGPNHNPNFKYRSPYPIYNISDIREASDRFDIIQLFNDRMIYESELYIIYFVFFIHQ